MCKETSLLASVLTLTVISVGRFVAVMFPIHSHTSPNHDHRVIAAVWVVSVLISCPTLFYRQLYSTEWSNFTSYACEEFWPTASEYNPETGACVVVFDAKKRFYTVLTIALYFLPVAIMFVTYSLVVWTRWKSQQPGELSGPSRNTAVRWNIVKMVLVVLLVFVLCWTPLQTLILYTNFFHAQHIGNLPEWFSTMEFLAYFLAYSNSALNPIIYWGFSASFREGLVTLITCGRRATLNSSYPRRWRGVMTGDTRDSTLPYSGPEPVVILEISSLRGTARLTGRGGGGASQRGRYVFNQRSTTRRSSSSRAPTDHTHHTSCKQHCNWTEQQQQQQQQPRLDSTSSHAINPASLMQQPECSEHDLGQNGSRLNSLVSHSSSTQTTAMGQNGSKVNSLISHCSRKLSSLSASSSTEGGDGCLCYQGKRRKKSKDVSLDHETQICEELRENLTHDTGEEMV
ncbi:hypothetical protein Pcinc_013067 [Petrolisthes cinctipes]|uniref:G-protein coupled receptors family 1 profile domain-containing protein n=1 Tax=Petrolisthes cinctipes TaxID=88211 RepID=A0AAE1FZW1_PETCI|nr:hypothetical protein Pcinc_013067 [Petrolisthes cinctipes]